MLGVMTPRKNNQSNLCALLGRQRRLLVHCTRQSAESCVEKKKQQACAVTNSSEFKEVTTLTLVSTWIKRCKTGTSVRNPQIQLTTGSEASGKSVADPLHLCGLGSSALEGYTSLNVLVRTWSACKPYQSKSVWSLVSGYTMFTIS